ncbi:MAG: hypothetical protein V3T05_07015, partial [Myxococcota bacterium]
EARFDETKQEARELLAALKGKKEGETDIQTAARLGHKEMRAKHLIRVIHQQWPGELGTLDKDYVSFTKEDDRQLAEALDRLPIGGTPAQLYELLESDYPPFIERHGTKVPKRIAKTVRNRLGVESWRVEQQTRLAKLMAQVSKDHPGASMRELYALARDVHPIAFPIASLRNGPARWKADPNGYPEIALLLDEDGKLPWEREVGAAAKPSGAQADTSLPAATWAAHYRESGTMPSVPAGETMDTFDDAQVKALHELYWSVPPGTSLTGVVEMAAKRPEFQGRTKPITDKQLGRTFAKMPESFPWEWRSRNLAFTSCVLVDALMAAPMGTSVTKIVDRLQMEYPAFPGRSTFTQASRGRGSWAAEPKRFPFVEKLPQRKDGTFVLEAQGEVRGVETTIHGKLKLNADLARTVEKLALSDDVRFDWELDDLNAYLRGKLGDGWSDSTFRNLRNRHGDILPDFHAIRHEAKRRLCELIRDLHGEPRNIDSAADMSRVLHEEHGFPEYDQVRYVDFRNDFDFVPKFRESRAASKRDEARALLDAILADPDQGLWETAKTLGHGREQAKWLLKVIHDQWPDVLPGLDAPRVAYTAADKKAMQQAIDDGPYGASMADMWGIMKTEHPEFFERHPLSGPMVLYQVVRRELGIGGWQQTQRLRTEELIAKVLDSPQQGMTLVDLHAFLQDEYDVRMSYSTLIKWQREWKKEPAKFPHITALSTRHNDPKTGKVVRAYPWDFAKIPYTESLAKQVTAVIEANEGKSLPEIMKILRGDPEFKARYPTFETRHIHHLRKRFDFVPLIDDLKVRGRDARQKAQW